MVSVIYNYTNLGFKKIRKYILCSFIENFNELKYSITLLE